MDESILATSKLQIFFEVIGLGYSRNIQTEGVEDMEFPGVLKKEHVEIPWVLVFDLGISKGCHKILQNFHGCSFVFFEFSASKVTNLKILGFFSENSPFQKKSKEGG